MFQSQERRHRAQVFGLQFRKHIRFALLQSLAVSLYNVFNTIEISKVFIFYVDDFAETVFLDDARNNTVGVDFHWRTVFGHFDNELAHPSDEWLRLSVIFDFV